MSADALVHQPSSASSGSSHVGTNDDEMSHSASYPYLRRLHLLPLVEDGKTDSKSRLRHILPVVLQTQATRTLRRGAIIPCLGSDYVVMSCDPAEGIPRGSTLCNVEGRAPAKFERIRLSAWGPEEPTQEALAEDFRAFCSVEAVSSEESPESQELRLLQAGNVFHVDQVTFRVEAVEPQRAGILVEATEVLVDWDATPPLKRIHIVPLRDTLPKAYAFDIFEDYLGPYLRAHRDRKFKSGELFRYQGVQFKVLACDPDSGGRINRQTTIYSEGTAKPSLMNLLPELPLHLSRHFTDLPWLVQRLLDLSLWTTRELNERFQHRRKLTGESCWDSHRFVWNATSENSVEPHTCTICQVSLVDGDDCGRLRCTHVFHNDCLVEWLSRTAICPLCKSRVDLSI
eukprot:CAMPEP_0170582386 /NCGR_PEP_ID=MMETSP0224-20130122/7556_1 /TAXON_ID=285029 /ORGANISM="Togula jolla, Strain CCCM 725" /LENGTH=399 /DNA_ID=CAMNT_0010905607 /DNA_START=47 /DNA_END=1243 /DNA_ORIENTATION=-